LKGAVSKFVAGNGVDSVYYSKDIIAGMNDVVPKRGTGVSPKSVDRYTQLKYGEIN
jgi:hypothetical protein